MRVHSHCQAMAARICAVILLTSALMVTHATVFSGEQDIPSIDFNSSQLYFPYNSLSLFYTCLCGDVGICTLFYEDSSVVRVCQFQPLTRSTATKTKTFLCDSPNQKVQRFSCSTQPPGQREFQCSDLSSTLVSHINGRHTAECTDKCVTILWNRCPLTYRNFDNDTLPLKGSCSRPTNSTNTATILGESTEPTPSFSQPTAGDNAIESAEICSEINYTGDNTTGSTQSSPVMENTDDNAIGSTQSSPVMENTGDNATGSTQSSPVMENTGDNSTGSTQSSPVKENTGDNSNEVILAVGIAVGACIILALSALTVFCLWRWRWRKSKFLQEHSQHSQQNQHNHHQQQVEKAPGPTYSQPVTNEYATLDADSVSLSNTPADFSASFSFSRGKGMDNCDPSMYAEPANTVTPMDASLSPYEHYHTIHVGQAGTELEVKPTLENEEGNSGNESNHCKKYEDIDLDHLREVVSAPTAPNHVTQTIKDDVQASHTYAECGEDSYATLFQNQGMDESVMADYNTESRSFAQLQEEEEKEKDQTEVHVYFKETGNTGDTGKADDQGIGNEYSRLHHGRSGQQGQGVTDSFLATYGSASASTGQYDVTNQSTEDTRDGGIPSLP